MSRCRASYELISHWKDPRTSFVSTRIETVEHNNLSPLSLRKFAEWLPNRPTSDCKHPPSAVHITPAMAERLLLAFWTLLFIGIVHLPR